MDLELLQIQSHVTSPQGSILQSASLGDAAVLASDHTAHCVHSLCGLLLTDSCNTEHPAGASLTQAG